jgi:hypothetical protein
MSSTITDETWFYERGHFHDAVVTAVRIVEDTLEISINDEWFNERGLSKPENETAPCTLKFIGATVIAGDINLTDGGWISEILPEAGGTYRFVLTDRAPVIIRATQVICEAME